MSGGMTPEDEAALRAQLAMRQALDEARTTPLFYGSGTNPARTLAELDATRKAEVFSQAKATAEAARVPDYRKPATADAEMPLPFQGDPDAPGMAARYGIPAFTLAASHADAQRAAAYESRGSDPAADARRVLHGALGQDAEPAIAAARALVQRDPALKAWLDRTGMANSPFMTRHLAAEARRRGIVR